MPQNNVKDGRLFLLNLAIGLGTFIQILDTSIANVSIPYIAGNLSVSAEQGTWVITAFAASNAIVLPLTGWLSDFFGRVRLFFWSLILFSLTSFLCALSTSLTMLVFFRVLQGAVAGSLIPLSQSLLMTSNPPEKRGAALGFWGMVVIVAPVLGPIIGGYLTDTYSWPWIFYINIPIGLFSAFIVGTFLKDDPTEIKRDPIDWIGLMLLISSVGSLQILLDKGKDLDWFESNVILSLAIISAVSAAYFAVWTSFQKYPLVDFSFFKSRNFALGTITTTVGYLVYFGSTVTLPLWLQTEQGYTPLWAGIAIAPIGIVPIFLSTSVGKNLYRFDLRKVATLCFLFFAGSLFLQSYFTSEVSIGNIMLARFLQGLGVTIFFLPLVQLSLGEIPSERYASASGLYNFIRILVGSGFGTSLSIWLWSRLETFHYSRLGEAITPFQKQTILFYDYLYQYSHQLTEPTVSRIIDRLVSQQAYLLATNDLSFLGAWIFLAIIPLLYFCKPVRSSTGQIVAE